jgi:hypothetical protein
MVARVSLCGLLASVLVLLPTAPAGATARSGVLSGFVVSAPAAPVCMPRVPCLRKAAGVVLAFVRGDVVRGRATTADDGSYRVMLVAGTYAVKVTHPDGVRLLKPLSVTIAAGETKRVTFYLDTSIR